MVRQEIENLIQRAVRKKVKIIIERPTKNVFGDYYTNLAIVVKKDPHEIISRIKSNIFEKVEIKNNFINFFLSKKYLQKQLKEILKQKDKFGELKIGKNKKTNIEFISANPTGPLHIGNGRGAFFGDVLANVLEKAGYKVFREYYVNDAKNNNQIQELGKTALGEGTSYLTAYLAELIKKLNPYLKKIKSETDVGYFLSQNILGDIRKFIKEKLKIKFDFWVFEQNIYRQNRVKKVYEFLKEKKLIYKKDEAWWLDLSKFNQKDEVLIKENGQPTYFLSDIAYHKYKIERGFKKIINIWGADHQGHIPRMKAVMEILGYKGEFDILITQIVRLKNRKMSKRKGEIITLEELINEVGLDVARFFYLTKSLDSQMEFDLDLAKEQSEKNPVYYIQYAYTRICGILRKTKNQKSPKESLCLSMEQAKTKNLDLLNHPSELALIKQLVRFPEIIEDTARDYQVQRIPKYALELANSFHKFYQDCRVLTEDKNLKEARLLLILATKTVLNNTLNIMGISTPEKM